MNVYLRSFFTDLFFNCLIFNNISYNPYVFFTNIFSMRHRNLFTLLASLTKDEFKRFGKFLMSPYFTNSSGVRVFYGFLKKHHPVFDEKKVQLEAAYERLFADRLKINEPIDREDRLELKRKMLNEKLDHLLSDMFRLLKTFMVVEEAMFNPSSNRKKEKSMATSLQLQARQSNGISIGEELLVKSLGRHDAYELYLKYSQDLVKKTEALTVKNTDDYWLLTQLNHWQYYHPDTNKYQNKLHGISEAMRRLDQCYLLSKLRYIAELLARAQIQQTEVHIVLLDEVIDSAKKLVSAHCKNGPELENHSLVAVYLGLVQLYLEKKDESDYNWAGDLFMQSAADLPLQEQRLLFAHFANIGGRQFSLENRPVGSKLLELNRWALNQGILVVNQRMTEATYLNISALAAEQEEYEWAEDFIQIWKPFLDENQAVDAEKAAIGHLLFTKGEFDKSHERIKNIASNKPPYSFSTRGLLLKIFFEKFLKDRGQYEHFSSHVAAFDKFISGQSIGKIKQEAWLNFVRFTRSLASIRLKEGRVAKQKKSKLKDELKAMKFVFSKKWLFQKIKDL